MSYTVGSTRVINTTSASGTTDFTFTFPYIKEAHIEVYKDYTKLNQGAGATEYQVITNVSPKLIRLGTATASANVRLEIRRNSSLDTPLVDYADGSTLTANDLDTSALQSLYIDQELKDSQFQTVSISATTGHPTLNNNPLTEVADPTNAQDAATKNYVDTKDALKLTKAGDSMTGALEMGTNKITGVGNPTAAQDAATKNYVDTQQISASQIGADSIGASQLQDNSVASANIIDGSIVNADINASAAIAHSKLALDITNADINASADIAGSKLANGGITAAKLHADAVITSSEHAGATVNDTSFLTSQASDARYFNVSTGDTIKDGDAFPDNDTTIATTAAINDRIVDLVDDVGGFVPIANETSFPATNPDVNNGTGTLVSIKEFAASRTPSSGTVTITDGAGSGNDITITGCGTTVLAAGYGGIVETTATLHTYSFHRLSPKATQVSTVAGNISNINSVAASLEGTQSYTVTVQDVGGSNYFFIDGTQAPVLDLIQGFTYTFDVSASSNSGHPLRFKDSSGNSYTTGITSSGTEGQSNATVTFAVATDAPSALRYYCTAHGNGMGNTITTGVNNISVVASSIGNVNTVAGSITNVNNVGGSIANVNTVGTNISNVNDFADKYRVASSAPTSNNDAGDLYFNTTSNELQVYNGSAWQGGVTATGNLAGLGANTFTGNQSLGDNNKVQLGTGNDLQIYHDGTNSYIKNDTGALYLRTGTGLNLQNAAGTETYLYTTENGGVFLKHDNVTKLETTSGGINVTGALTVNGAAVGGGGGSFEATADGAIAANKPCVLRADGKVAQAALETSSQSSGFDIGKTSFIHGSASSSAASEVTVQYSADYDTTNKKVLQVYNLPSGDDKFYGIVGTVSGSGPSITVSWGTPFLINSNYIRVAICIYNPNEKKFLVGGGDATVSKTKFWHVTLNPSGAATVSSVLSFETKSSTDWGPNADYDGFIPCHNKQNTQLIQIMTSGHASGFGANPPLNTMTINMSGDAPTFEQCSTFAYGGHTLHGTSTAWDEVNNRILVWFSNQTRQGWSSWSHKAGFMSLPVSYDSTNNYWWWDTDNKVEDIIYDSSSTGSPYYNCSLVYMPTHGAFLARYDYWTGSAWQSKARVVTLDSSGNITKGTELTYNHNSEDGSDHARYARNRLVVRKDSSNVEKVYQVGCQSDSTSNSFVQTFTISGTGSSASVAVAFTTLGWSSSGVSTSWNATDTTTGCLVDDSIVFTQSTNSGNSNSARTIQSGAIWFAGRNSTDDSFVGFSDAAYSDTATATINVVGNTTTQSGLSPATNYYVAADGTLTTSASDNPYAGKALTATSLLIKG